MRSLLITTDLIRKSDGTLTPTEINTSSSYELVEKNSDRTNGNTFIENWGDYFEHVEFHGFLQNNNISKGIESVRETMPETEIRDGILDFIQKSDKGVIRGMI
jgi:hypothetical protein